MTDPLYTNSNSQRPRSRLRKACDFCHQSKVKCTGDSPCSRCIELDIPCRYGFVIRTGKPKGSRNRKTLEKAERLRQEATMRTKHLYSPLQDQDNSSSSSCSTNSATGEGEIARTGMSPGEEILMPWDWHSNWMMLPEGDRSQSPSEIHPQPGETGIWGSDEEEAFQLPLLGSTDLPFISDSLSPLHIESTDPLFRGTHSLNTANSAAQPCACVSYLLNSKSQLCTLTLDPIQRDRFDLGMQVINNVWARVRGVLQCESHEHHFQVFFLMSWYIRMACGWFQSQASIKHQHETSVLGSQPAINEIGMRCGEYEIPHQQVHVMHGLLIHMAVQEGIDLLRGLRCIMEKEASSPDLAVNVVSLNPVDVTYILAVLAKCEEEMLRILHLGKEWLKIDVDD
ncbi:hypothetical protein N8T08_007894 [Aspergillus melleus]|uniref:Uncharacterized protein n=1 Tax=Aspergillus melleus TaxID=138277 RepID=A0ACC3AX95_9EURO|nr:hypothetical protein N8T08_007894 [Aspergillus melleus]